MITKRPTVGQQSVDSRPTDNSRPTGFLGSSSSQLPATVHQHRVNQLFVSWWRYFLAAFVGIAFCLAFFVQKNTIQSTVMRVNNRQTDRHLYLIIKLRVVPSGPKSNLLSTGALSTKIHYLQYNQANYNMNKL